MSKEGRRGKGMFEELKRLVGFGTPGQRLVLAFQEGFERSGDGAVILYELSVDGLGSLETRTGTAGKTVREATVTPL